MTIATQPPPRANIALADDDHEQVVIRQDPETGLRFIVAVHSTVLGPALGGMRLKRYPGGLREALDGAYITAEDIGTTCADMDYVARFTRFCVGRSRENGGQGDPSPVTAES